MIEVIEKDIIEAYKDGDIDILVHQVNCQGVWGKGLAKKLKENFPDAFKDYFEEVEAHKAAGVATHALLGSYDFWWDHCEDVRGVASVYGQCHYGNTGRYTLYYALMSGLFEVFINHGDKVIGIPYGIGCGLGGGDWGEVERMIEEAVFELIHTGVNRDLNVVFYKLPE